VNFIGVAVRTGHFANVMKIAIISDHAGFAYEEKIKTRLVTLGHEVRDFGTNSDAPVDYPAFNAPSAFYRLRQSD